MSKQQTRSAYVGNFINYLLYLPDPFPKGLRIDLQGSSIFPPLMLLIHINRLYLFSHLYRTLLICLSTCLGSWVGTTALYREVGWRCTVSVSDGCSAHQLPGCKCIGNRSHTPLGCQNSTYMGIYGHVQSYIQVFTCMYKLQTYICIIMLLWACLFVLKCFYIRRYMRI